MAARAGGHAAPRSFVPPHTRVALPDEEGNYRVLDIAADSFADYSATLADMVGEELGRRGAPVPSVALREVFDNTIHALPCAVSVVIDARARNVCVSDTGPGISRLDLAFELGYSTADESLRSYIRGVGIGLHLAREDLRSLGGDMRIESDPGRGTYVQLSLARSPASSGWYEEGEPSRLTPRQNNILFLLSEGESLGPSQISSELNIGVSTAHRDLVKLQQMGLIFSNSTGKRFLSELGRSYLQSLLSL